MAFEIVKDEELKRYNLEKLNVLLPTRKTRHSAGYDIHTPIDLILPANDKILVPTGLKCQFPKNWCLKVSLRSSIATRKKIIMLNAEGLIDSDYYNNNSNDGNIFISMYNLTDEDIYIEQCTAIAQGTLVPYHTFEDIVKTKRTGGIGSTDNVE